MLISRPIKSPAIQSDTSNEIIMIPTFVQIKNMDTVYLSYFFMKRVGREETLSLFLSSTIFISHKFLATDTIFHGSGKCTSGFEKCYSRKKIYGRPRYETGFRKIRQEIHFRTTSLLLDNRKPPVSKLYDLLKSRNNCKICILYVYNHIIYNKYIYIIYSLLRMFIIYKIYIWKRNQSRLIIHIWKTNVTINIEIE